MGCKKMPGLTKRGEFWHINKVVNGHRICESTGSGELQEAERYLVRRLEEIRQATVYGVRPKRSFRMATAKYLEEGVKKSLKKDIVTIKQLDKFIGHLPLEAIHMGSLQPFIKARKEEGVVIRKKDGTVSKKREIKSRTINHGLQLTRRILNLASTVWRDEHGLTWLLTAPKITLLPQDDARKPYPLNWEEQNKLFAELPEHLRQMALFAVNSGCRDQEICNLKWEWEVPTPLGSVFIIPSKHVKNKEDRLVVLNHIGRTVIEAVRGQHPTSVFTYQGKAIYQMSNKGWDEARIKAGLPTVRVHDLKHTFGRRLRAAGVSFEDRQDLLGHKSGRITTHYSAAELSNLLAAANKVCDGQSSPLLVMLRNAANAVMEKPQPAEEIKQQEKVA